MRARLIGALVGAGLLASCATSPYDSREPWELYVQAAPVGPGVVHVRTMTLAPNACYGAGEVRSAAATQPQAIQVQATLTRTGQACAEVLTEVVHDLPALRIEPDDRFLEVVVSADGVERNRAFVEIASAPPVGGGYYDDPRYPDPDYRDPRYPDSRY